ncbi:MAG: lipopolysaccharide biosynthesis protein, partial [Acidimicrobiales bacterium]|nr:lipopolysaccharide biosynthesis protein [Acidimicrobiales bacterium]
LQTFSAVSGWFSLLDLGLGTAGTREVAARRAVEDLDGADRAAGTTIGLHAALGVAGGLAVAAIGPWAFPTVFRTPEDLRDALTVAIVAFGAQVAVELTSRGYQAVLDGQQRVDLARVVELVRRTLVAAATSIAALATGDLATVAIASAVASAIAAATGPLLLARADPGRHRRADRSTARELFAYGRTVAVLRPLGVLHRTVDRFVVGVLLGPGAVSLVEIATQLQNGADAVLSASSYAVVPGAAHLDAHGERGKLAELLQTGTRYVLLATWPVAALTAVLAGPGIDLWVGSDYAEAAGLTALALVSTAATAPAQVGSNLLLGTGRASAILRVALLAIVVNVALSIALVEAIGVAGAFAATLASAAISLPLLLHAALDEVGLGAGEFVRRAVVPALPAAVAAAAAAGAVVLAPLGSLVTLVVGGGLGVLAALAGTWLVGLDPTERAGFAARLRTGR